MPTPTPDHKIVCTLFNGIRPAVRDVWEGSWEAFAGELLPVLVAERKRQKKALTGIVLAPFGGPRSDASVGAHTALAIDIDRLPDNDLGALLKRAAAFRCAVYETPSSADDAPRVRVIVALQRELAPEHVIAARSAFAEALGLDPDECGTTGAHAASQVMFVGRLRGTRARGLWAFDGKAFKAPRICAPTPKRIPPSPRSTERREPRKLEAGAFDFDSPPDLSALAKHVPPPGVDGDRHLLVRAVGGWLARRGYAPEAIAEAVRDQVPSSDPAERAAQALDAALRVRRGEEAPGWEALTSWAERYAKGASTLRRLERACRDPREPEGFGGDGAEGAVWSEWWVVNWPKIEERFERLRGKRPVTDGVETLPGAGSEIDATGLHLHPRTGWPWILQKGDSYWLHAVSDHTYTPEVRASELEASIARDLAGLVSEEDRTPTALRSKWIRPIRYLRSAYQARTHTYDQQARTLTLAALQWAPFAARRHAHVNRWLRALLGDGYGAGAQWLAAVVELDRPAPCLYLPGPKGLGKSLLADGLAALWSRPSPVKMRDAIKDFNQSTGECPLIFTDEGFPEKLNFSEFREMITQHSRAVNAKFRQPVDVEGCGRFIIAANNEDVLRYQKIGTLTSADLDAIADRLLVVSCHEEARAVLETHTHAELREWARRDIAEHVLWLAQTVALEPTGRMAAKPGGGERILASVVAARNSDVLNRIRDALGTGAMGEKSGVHVPKANHIAPASASAGGVSTSEVWVNVRRLAATFDGRVRDAQVVECCESFALRPEYRPHRARIDGENLRWRVLSRLRLDEAFAKLD